MLELIESIPNSPSDKNDEIIRNIQDYWESQILPMKLSINYREIDEISNLIDTIQMANESNDSSKLAINIELLKNAIEKIIQLEKISIRNIAKNDSRKRVILVFLYPVSIKK
jgi:septin family protein